jgi:hypothetical protein
LPNLLRAKDFVGLLTLMNFFDLGTIVRKGTLHPP